MEPAAATFRGVRVHVEQEALPPPSEQLPGDDTTGRLVWECSSLFLKWLSTDSNLLTRLAPGATGGLCLVDVSCGAGLVPLALCSALPSPLLRAVLAWETEQRLPHLQRSLAAVLGRNCKAQAYYWGQDPGVLLGGGQQAHGALCSDVLYIALRDGLARQLSCTLRHLARLLQGGAILFGFEERLLREEEEFMQSLALPLPPLPCGGGAGSAFWEGAAPALAVEELAPAEAALSKEEAIGTPDIFWEPPHIRLFLLRPG